MAKRELSLGGAVDATALSFVDLGKLLPEQQHGVYELEGTTLRLCVSPPGQDRPADLSSAAGDGRLLTVWRLAEP